MSLNQLENLLQKSPLERETKLQIIDVIAYANDETTVNHLISLLVEWKKRDDEAMTTLTQQIEALKTQRTQDEETITNKAERTAREIADVVGREKKIQTIRNSIINSI